MQVICLREEALYVLIEKVFNWLKEKESQEKWKWISGTEAMQKLGIKSKSTLQALRDEGQIRFSQPMKKIILYDSDSINDYLNKDAQNTF